MTDALIDVVVAGQTIAGHGVVALTLRHPEREPLPAPDPGAHIDLHLPAARALIRQYSVVDASGEDSYVVAVQDEPEGRGGSRYVHERLRVGDHVKISAPRSTFPLALDRPAVLLAGGIGITPLIAMADALAAAGTPFELHGFANGELPLSDLIATRAWASSVRAYDTRVVNPLRDATLAWTITPDTIVYACGPGSFLDSVRTAALSAGVPEEAVRVERFAIDEPVSLEGDAFTVVAATTGERMPVAEGETIAEVLDRHGYEVVLSCEQGICGSCLTGVLSGVPDHRDEIQTAAEHAANDQINVCVSRSCTPDLVLDL